MVLANVFLCSVLLALAAATEVLQCQGKTFEALSDNVQLLPCKTPPCRLKKGKVQNISIKFTPEKDLEKVFNHVTATVLSVPVPFLGVDGNPICDKLETPEGEKVSCPLKAGTTYVYKDSFPIYKIYPEITTKVHWELREADGKSVICFEVPARIS